MAAPSARALRRRRHVRGALYLPRVSWPTVRTEFRERGVSAPKGTRRMRPAGNAAQSGGNASVAGDRRRPCARDDATQADRPRTMTPLNKTVRRLTVDEYGYGRNRRNLVVALEKGDLITLREHGCRTRHTARLWDLWWMLRCEADKVRMEKLRERKHHKAAR